MQHHKPGYIVNLRSVRLPDFAEYEVDLRPSEEVHVAESRSRRMRGIGGLIPRSLALLLILLLLIVPIRTALAVAADELAPSADAQAEAPAAPPPAAEPAPVEEPAPEPEPEVIEETPPADAPEAVEASEQATETGESVTDEAEPTSNEDSGEENVEVTPTEDEGDAPAAEADNAMEEEMPATTTPEVVADETPPSDISGETEETATSTKEVASTTPTTAPEAAPSTLPTETATATPPAIETPAPTNATASTSLTEAVADDTDDELEHALAEQEAILRAEFADEIASLQSALNAATSSLAEKEAETPNTMPDLESDKCTLLGEGEIYCVSKKAMVGSEGNAGPSKEVESRADESGDREIYFQKGGVVTQLTDNDVDDVNPSYDAEHGVIAWQTRVDDRWQIVAYDLSTHSITQVTDGPSNSINPVIRGNELAWQGWGTSHWDIFYARKEGGVWRTRRITDNDVHDVRPTFGTGLLLWESFQGGTWQIAARDLASGEDYLVSAGVGKNANPRMVIVWDHIDANGVTETLEYSLDDKEIRVIASSAGKESKAPLKSEDLPEPYEDKAALPVKSESRATSSPTGKPDDTEE